MLIPVAAATFVIAVATTSILIAAILIATILVASILAIIAVVATV
jgi:hypothetical protein